MADDLPDKDVSYAYAWVEKALYCAAFLFLVFGLAYGWSTYDGGKAAYIDPLAIFAIIMAPILGIVAKSLKNLVP
ncbi:hypothetical protein [Gluconobacter morbifer]|uniref:Uncharacterized protein n=1 Tax=Gluconobacter morbifer G707 TaxID=1088869 RepID=G6XH23_9PROT|nr:hypothetical protein [Gluconobacter morbifer]EHH69481.1 hypothetical protein GMO_07880 [Gluconobacter morbifer G707]